MFLNEETTDKDQEEAVNDVIIDENYEGEDVELIEIATSHEQYMNNLTIAMIMAEHKAVVDEDKSIYEEAKDGFFKRAGDAIKKFWAKVVVFFKALWDKVVGVFRNREKWVKTNRKKIDAFDPSKNVSVNLPKNFKGWDTKTEAAKINAAQINTMMDFAVGASAGKADVKQAQSIGGAAAVRKHVNKVLIGKFEENVNYSAYYNEKIGEMVNTNLDKSIVEFAVNQVELTKAAGNLMKEVKDIEKNVIGRMSKTKAANLSGVSVLSSLTVACVKALHNTSIRMGNYAWVVCRRAAAAGGAEDKGAPTEESTDNTKTDENEDKGYNDVLSQYLND